MVQKGNSKLEHGIRETQYIKLPAPVSLLICKIAGNELWEDDIQSGVSDWVSSVLSGELRAASLWGRIVRQIKWSNNVPKSRYIYLFMFHAFASLAVALESVRPLVLGDLFLLRFKLSIKPSNV